MTARTAKTPTPPPPPTSATNAANSDSVKSNEGFRSIYLPPLTKHYGSLEEEGKPSEITKQEDQMRQLELEYNQQHQRDRQHCRRHNISAYNYYAQSEFAFQTATHLQDNNTNNNNNNENNSNRNKGFKMVEKWFNIRWIGAALFVAASVFCLYEIWVLSNQKPPIVTNKLLMVNIFTRHGDRKYS